MAFQKGYISDDVFYEALKYVPPSKQGTCAIHGMGEPLLHPKIFDYMEEMARKKLIFV